MDVADSPAGLDLTVAQHDGTASVAARGEVDIHTCAALEKALVELAGQGARAVTLDLGEVGFIDSSGLRALVVGHNALQERGGALVVANPSPATARLLEVTGLDSLFVVTGS
jgi:anti-sigma B factor antagonist